MSEGMNFGIAADALGRSEPTMTDAAKSMNGRNSIASGLWLFYDRFSLTKILPQTLFTRRHVIAQLSL